VKGVSANFSRGFTTSRAAPLISAARPQVRQDGECGMPHARAGCRSSASGLPAPCQSTQRDRQAQSFFRRVPLRRRGWSSGCESGCLRQQQMREAGRTAHRSAPQYRQDEGLNAARWARSKSLSCTISNGMRDSTIAVQPRPYSHFACASLRRSTTPSAASKPGPMRARGALWVR